MNYDLDTKAGMSNYYAITGRVHGWDEDSVWVGQAADRYAAISMAKDYFWSLDGASEKDREEATIHGEGVYINAVLTSATPITETRTTQGESK